MADATGGAVARPRGVRYAVDVGRARVGVARCDPDGLLASPVTTLRRERRSGADLGTLTESILEWDAVLVYVGLPVNLRGSSTPSTEDAVAYARELARRLAAAGSAAEVRLVDERLTTVSAQRQLHEAGRSVRTSRTVIDQAAAVAILEQALELEHAGPAGQPID